MQGNGLCLEATRPLLPDHQLACCHEHRLFFAKLSKTGARPNKFRCTFNIRAGEFERKTIDISVRSENDEPLWFIHPAQDTRAVDIVAIPLDADTLEGRVTLWPVNELAPSRIAIIVGMDVFILGYPFGSDESALPVWKRGSIASESDHVKIKEGYYLVDTASRPGMSGSPVILRSWNGSQGTSRIHRTASRSDLLERLREHHASSE